MKYHVEHNRGTAGINESTVEEFDNIESSSPLAAIRFVANIPEGWVEETETNTLGRTATITNPNVANASGKFCDYWFCFPMLADLDEIADEPDAETIDTIYSNELTIPLVSNGQKGKIHNGAGGWGNAAIRVEMADGTKLFARERESEDYENVERDSLEVYGWERPGESGYYSTIANALARANVSTRAF